MQKNKVEDEKNQQKETSVDVHEKENFLRFLPFCVWEAI